MLQFVANMKFSLYFLVLCALGLFAIAAYADDEVDVPERNDDELFRNPALAAAVRIIRMAIKWAAKHCAEEAAHHCKQHWKNPKALVNCAKGFLEANKGRCVAG